MNPRITILGRAIKLACICAMASLGAGCTGLAASVANIPSYFSPLQRHADIAYGTEPQQKLDIYTPSQPSAAPLPVVVFLHGGRWTYGHKGQFRFVASRMVQEGFIVLVPDYAKYPHVKFPALMDDPAKAVVWAKEHISSYGGDPSRLYVMGHSSGAHMGALLVSDPRHLEKAGGSPKSITAFAGLAGPYAFTPDEPELQDMFGPPERYPEMQAPHFITGGEPPMLLLHGGDDETVGIENLNRLASAIRSHHGIVETKSYQDMGHISIIANFALAQKRDASVAADCAAFFNRHP